MHAALPSGGEVCAPVLLPGDLGVGVAGGSTFKAGRGAGPDGNVVGHFGERREHCRVDRVKSVESWVQRPGVASVRLTSHSQVSAHTHCPLCSVRLGLPPAQNQEPGFLSAADRSCRKGGSYHSLSSCTQGWLGPLQWKAPLKHCYCLSCGDLSV